MAKKEKAVKEPLKEEKVSADVSSIASELRELEQVPETIHGKPVASISFQGDKVVIVDVERSIFGLPMSEYNLWKEGKLYK